MNLDGSITPDDYMAVDANLGLGQSLPLAIQSVPEPACASALAAAMLMTRRRRTR
ncbi:MAG TPA: hypothetical protein VF669_10925 [Tepidisphaeraceae bacterium]|jgi:hypothetical protein